MSYYRKRKWYSKKKWYREKKLVLPPKYDSKGFLIIDCVFTEKPERKIDIVAFLRNEFLTCDKLTFGKMASLYEDNYGKIACSYMKRTYLDWKSGKITMTGHIAERMAQFVPPFLSDDKRFLILKWEVQYYLDTIRFEYMDTKGFNKAIPNSINKSFHQFEQSIDKFNSSNLGSFFIDKKFFSVDEVDQFIYACKYALKEKLQQSYDQVRKDISLIKLSFVRFKILLFDGSYTIDFLNSTFDLREALDLKEEPLLFCDSTFRLSGGFKALTERHILNELLEISFVDRRATIDGAVNSANLAAIMNEFNEGKRRKQNISILARLQGYGGVLNVNLEHIPNREFYNSILLCLIRLILILSATSVSAFLIFSRFRSFSLFFYIALFFICPCFLTQTKILINILNKFKWKKT